MTGNLINELLYSSLFITSTVEAKAIISQIKGGLPTQDKKTYEYYLISGSGKKNCFSDPSTNQTEIFEGSEKGSILILPIIGTMTKYWSWWSIGMDEIAELIRLADNANEISGTILLFNTPGGSTQSVIQLEDALKNRTKPCIALVDGNALSCGIYAASFCDKIFAINRMCEVGSIGVMFSLMDDRKWLEEVGLKQIDIYPPESRFKNKEWIDALDGNTETLIAEKLSPFAIHFQNIIKENRQSLDLSVEGIVEGKTFYAYDAVNNGLIDGIKNMDEVVAEINTMYKNMQILYSQFK